MTRTVFANGAFVREDQPHVSMFDRGFLFADGVYEVTAVVAGRLVDFGSHMARLLRSLGSLRIASPMTGDELRGMHQELITRNHLANGYIYMQITRGAADRDFKFPDHATPSVIAFTMVKDIIHASDADRGVAVITVPDQRWARRDIKTVMLLAPVLGKQAAHEAGAFEAWMVEDGLVTEGTSSNAWIVRDGVVITRGLSHEILAGCTRAALFDLARQHGIRIEERAFSPAEAIAADEAFLTSATNFVMPVVEIDGQRIGGGQPGPLTRTLRDLYIRTVAGTP